MNKKYVLQSMKIIVLGLILSLLGVGYVFAQKQVNPTSPLNNVPGPLNVGPSNQAKAGGLDITAGSLRVTGIGGFRSHGPIIADDTLNVGNTATFMGKAYVGGAYQGAAGAPTTQAPSFLARISKFLGINEVNAQAIPTDLYTLTVYGKTNLTSDTSIGGGVAIAGNTTISGGVAITENAIINGGIKINSLKFTSPANSTKQICVNNSGQLIYCLGASCGLANGVSSITKPTTDLCSSVTDVVSEVTPTSGPGPWSWACTNESGSVGCSSDQACVHNSAGLVISSPQTWTLPAGCDDVLVRFEMHGGGGEGGDGTGGGGGGGGGGGAGGINIQARYLPGGTSIPITIGNGGSGASGHGDFGKNTSVVLPTTNPAYNETVTALGGHGGGSDFYGGDGGYDGGGFYGGDGGNGVASDAAGSGGAGGNGGGYPGYSGGLGGLSGGGQGNGGNGSAAAGLSGGGGGGAGGPIDVDYSAGMGGSGARGFVKIIW